MDQGAHINRSQSRYGHHSYLILTLTHTESSTTLIGLLCGLVLEGILQIQPRGYNLFLSDLSQLHDSVLH